MQEIATCLGAHDSTISRASDVQSKSVHNCKT